MQTTLLTLPGMMPPRTTPTCPLQSQRPLLRRRHGRRSSSGGRRSGGRHPADWRCVESGLGGVLGCARIPSAKGRGSKDVVLVTPVVACFYTNCLPGCRPHSPLTPSDGMWIGPGFEGRGSIVICRGRHSSRDWNQMVGPPLSLCHAQTPHPIACFAGAGGAAQGVQMGAAEGAKGGSVEGSRHAGQQRLRVLKAAVWKAAGST